MRSVTKITINPSPKTVELITIVSTQREVTEDNTTSIFVFNTTDRKKAWEYLKEGPAPARRPSHSAAMNR